MWKNDSREQDEAYQVFVESRIGHPRGRGNRTGSVVRCDGMKNACQDGMGVVGKSLQLQTIEQREVTLYGIPDFGNADVFIGRVGA